MYVMNSAVITLPGTYEYRVITLEEAVRWLSENHWQSKLRYLANARILRDLTGRDCPVDRSGIAMQPGEEALVMRLPYRMGEADYKRDQGFQGNLTASVFEWGILRRLR